MPSAATATINPPATFALTGASAEETRMAFHRDLRGIADGTHMKIALGVSGGIAAYKAAEIVRLLQDRGVRVQVVMTAAAQEFVRPLTFAAVSYTHLRAHETRH